MKTMAKAKGSHTKSPHSAHSEQLEKIPLWVIRCSSVMKHIFPITKMPGITREEDPVRNPDELVPVIVEVTLK